MTKPVVKICPTHGEWGGQGRRYCPQCFTGDVLADQKRRYARDYNRRMRLSVIQHYGGKCVCCGETEEAFLCIDHVEGGGNAHRRELVSDSRGSASRMCQWLVLNGFPDGYQLLCANCNMGKERPGGCPHERMR